MADLITPNELRAAVHDLFPPGRARRHALLRLGVCPFAELMAVVPPGATMLDVGCGSGLLLLLLAATGRIGRGVGFDASPRAIEVALRAAARLGGERLHFEDRAVEDPWPDGAFDVVSMVDVLHHVQPSEQRAAVIEALGRVDDRGRWLYKDMCTRPRWRAAANHVHDLAAARQWIRIAPLPDVTAWARDEGFAASRSMRINRLWYGHDLCVFERGAEGA